MFYKYQNLKYISKVNFYYLYPNLVSLQEVAENSVIGLTLSSHSKKRKRCNSS